MTLGQVVPTVIITAAASLHGAIRVTIEHRLWLATMCARSWIGEFGDNAHYARRPTPAGAEHRRSVDTGRRRRLAACSIRRPLLSEGDRAFLGVLGAEHRHDETTDFSPDKLGKTTIFKLKQQPKHVAF